MTVYSDTLKPLGNYCCIVTSETCFDRVTVVPGNLLQLTPGNASGEAVYREGRVILSLLFTGFAQAHGNLQQCETVSSLPDRLVLTVSGLVTSSLPLFALAVNVRRSRFFVAQRWLRLPSQVYKSQRHPLIQYNSRPGPSSVSA